jgi:carboxyl-terminal processing protease
MKKKFFQGKVSLSVVWIVSTLVLCTVFILASAHQGTAQEQDRNTGSVSAAQPNSARYASMIRNVFDFIQRQYVEEVDPKVLYEGAMQGMFNALGDPNSAFLPESEMSSLNDTTQGNFGGVGLYISKPLEPGPGGKPPYVEVAAPMEDTPGWRAGINPGDLIIKINEESTDVLSMDEVLARLRGTPGEEVKLIIRRGEKLEFPVTLVRAVIEVPAVKFAMIDKIGYLKLLTFTPMTADRALEAVNDFKAKGYKSLILDVRNNTGGLLNSAVDISSLFLEGGVVVSTKSRIAANVQTLYTRGKAAVDAGIPIVVLINRGSASASEIVAGALKDRGRAYLVGEKSFGKGSVQQVYPLDNKAGFRLTTARYYTPSDVNIDKIGIPPDREVKFPDFTDADAEKLNELINANKIPEFVASKPQASTAEIEAFVRELSREYGLDFSMLRRLVRNEQNRTAIAPVYDLEYDVQLQEAVKILKEENFQDLMKASKTLKALQDEAFQSEEAAAS